MLWVMVVEVGGEVEDLSTPSYLDQRITENIQLCHRTIGMARRWPSCQGPNKITGRLKKIGARCHIEAGGAHNMTLHWYPIGLRPNDQYQIRFVSFLPPLQNNEGTLPFLYTLHGLKHALVLLFQYYVTRYHQSS